MGLYSFTLAVWRAYAVKMNNHGVSGGPVGAVPDFELRHRLRLAREHAGLDQRQMHAATGLSRATISAAETGRAQPHPATVRLWAMACGVSYAWLVSGEQMAA